MLLTLGPNQKNALFPVTSPIVLRSVGRQTFFYKKRVWKKYKKSFKKSKNRLNIPKAFKRAQNIRVGKVTGNETFIFWP